MSEPTIPEAAVEAAAKAVLDYCNEHEQWRDRDLARAALAAAEPLMHEGCRATVDRLVQAMPAVTTEDIDLRAENARLQQDLAFAVAEVGRLRSHLGSVAYFAQRAWGAWDSGFALGPYMAELRDAASNARAALAPSDEEPGT